MKIQNPLIRRVLPTFAYWFFRALRGTWRLEEEVLPFEICDRVQKGLPVVYCHFHEDEWALLGFYAVRKMTVLVSVSQDGALMANFLKKLGFFVARGSSSNRGAAGFLQLVREVKKSPHGFVSLAIDGPRGPRRVVKPGVLQLARLLDAPIVAAATFARPAWVFRKAWSRAYFPKPFSRLKMCYSSMVSAQKIREMLKANQSELLLKEIEGLLLQTKVRAESVEV